MDFALHNRSPSPLSPVAAVAPIALHLLQQLDALRLVVYLPVTFQHTPVAVSVTTSMPHPISHHTCFPSPASSAQPSFSHSLFSQRSEHASGTIGSIHTRYDCHVLHSIPFLTHSLPSSTPIATCATPVFQLTSPTVIWLNGCCLPLLWNGNKHKVR